MDANLIQKRRLAALNMDANLIRKRRLAALKKAYNSLASNVDLLIGEKSGPIVVNHKNFERHQDSRKKFALILRNILLRIRAPEKVRERLEILWAKESSAFEVILKWIMKSKDKLDDLKIEGIDFEITMKKCDRAIKLGGNIFISGEMGTGKEFWTKHICKASKLHKMPFIPINCTSVPDKLFSAQLFGYKKGSFTDAKVDNPGILVAADGGTVFLDEIGDLSEHSQASLLRVVETKDIITVGETKEKKVNVRFIAATNKPNRVRPDLRSRFEHKIELPPLRSCKQIIVGLAPNLLREENEESGLKKDTRRILKKVAIELSLAEYQWPGNIRQLKSAIKMAANAFTGRHLECDTIIKCARDLE